MENKVIKRVMSEVLREQRMINGFIKKINSDV